VKVAKGSTANLVTALERPLSDGEDTKLSVEAGGILI
jgi:hypothetical protein